MFEYENCSFGRMTLEWSHSANESCIECLSSEWAIRRMTHSNDCSFELSHSPNELLRPLIRPNDYSLCIDVQIISNLTFQNPPSSLALQCQNPRRSERFLIIQVRFSTRGVRSLLPSCFYSLGSPRFLLVSIGKPWNRIPHYPRGYRVVFYWIRIVSELPIGPTKWYQSFGSWFYSISNQNHLISDCWFEFCKTWFSWSLSYCFIQNQLVFVVYLSKSLSQLDSNIFMVYCTNFGA